MEIRTDVTSTPGILQILSHSTPAAITVVPISLKLLHKQIFIGTQLGPHNILEVYNTLHDT